MSFKVLLCGGSGLLGQELLHSVPEGIDVWAPSSAEVDLRNKAQVQEQLHRYQPSLIINTAAYTNVDAAEVHEDLAYAVNRDGPENLGHYAAEANIPVFHVSTDYVFDGTKGASYTEEDEPNPVNVYGQSKLAGERALQQVCEQSLILRTSWLVGEHGDCFVRRFIVLMMEKESIDVVADQYSALTRVDACAAYIWVLAERVRQHLPIHWGVTNFSGSELSSKYDVVKKIFDALVKKDEKLRCIRINPVSHNFFSTSAKRPEYSLLKIESTNNNYFDFFDLCSNKSLDELIQRIHKKIISQSKTEENLQIDY